MDNDWNGIRRTATSEDCGVSKLPEERFAPSEED